MLFRCRNQCKLNVRCLSVQKLTDVEQKTLLTKPVKKYYPKTISTTIE